MRRAVFIFAFLAGCGGGAKPVAMPEPVTDGTLAQFNYASTVFVDAENVFVLAHAGAGWTRLHRVARTGGPPELLVGPAPFSQGLAQCDDKLVWAYSESGSDAGTKLEAIAKRAPAARGDEPRALTTIADGQIEPKNVAGDGAFVYWTSALPGAGESRVVRRISCSGGAAEDISPAGSNVPLAAGSGAAVFADSRSRMTTGERIVVVRADRSPRVVVEVRASVSAVATDGTTAFWVEDDSVIKRAPLDGGVPEILAAGEGGAASLALDGSTLCWTVRRALRCTSKKPSTRGEQRIATVLESTDLGSGAFGDTIPFALSRGLVYALVDRKLVVKALPPSAR